MHVAKYRMKGFAGALDMTVVRGLGLRESDHS